MRFARCALRAAEPQAAVRIVLGGGTYRIGQTIVFDLRDSAAGNATTEVIAAPNERPVLSGAAPLPGGWRPAPEDLARLPKQARGHVWMADVPADWPAFRTLFQVDTMLPRARTRGLRQLKVAPTGGHAIDQQHLYLPAEAVRSIADFSRAEMVVVPVHPWVMNVLPMSEVDRATGLVRTVVPANGRLYWMPLACDCWQVHGTFSMAPRLPLKEPGAATESHAWAAPASNEPAARDDWPMFRANSSGTATVPATVGQKARELWRRHLPGGDLTAPVCAKGRVFVGAIDGTVWALDATDGEILWQASSHAAVLHPPAYWNGRIIFGSCDGVLYCVDASNGRLLGCAELATEKRFINIMNRLMSAWPLSGGVVLSDDGTAYTAAGSTAADGAVAAAVDVTTGRFRWRQAYTLDRTEPKLSFGVQANLLLKNNTLYINGGAPVGIVALDAPDGGGAHVVSKLEAGMEMFLEPDNKPSCTGPELFSHERARTTIFKRHQGRVYFQTSGRHIALIDGRLFCSRDPQLLDRIVELMNKEPKASGNIRDVMQVALDDSVLWTGATNDVCGLAVGADGLVVLHNDNLEGVSADGRSLWTARLPAAPVRWGAALTNNQCVVTLSDGLVVCWIKDSQKR